MEAVVWPTELHSTPSNPYIFNCNESLVWFETSRFCSTLYT